MYSWVKILLLVLVFQNVYVLKSIFTRCKNRSPSVSLLVQQTHSPLGVGKPPGEQWGGRRCSLSSCHINCFFKTAPDFLNNNPFKISYLLSVVLACATIYFSFHLFIIYSEASYPSSKIALIRQRLDYRGNSSVYEYWQASWLDFLRGSHSSSKDPF